MKRLAITGAALFAAVSVAASLGAATTKPYVGEWKARMTADSAARPRASSIREPSGCLEARPLAQDGTYRAFNPLDKWTSGDYSATRPRIVLQE